MFVIARNTLKEFIRNKLMYLILGFAIWMIFLTIVISKLALSEQSKIIIDFSLTIVEISGLILTLFLWSSLLYNEISKNTILLILSKNPSRTNFILWKFLWFAFILLLLYIVLWLSFIIALYIHHIPFSIVYIGAILLSYIKIVVLLWFIIFFSTFMSPFFSLIISLWIYIISHMTSFVKFYMLITQKVKSWSILENLIAVIYYIFPNFQDLSMKEYLLSPELSAYTWYHITLSCVSNIFYVSIILLFAIIIFKKREF